MNTTTRTTRHPSSYLRLALLGVLAAVATATFGQAADSVLAQGVAEPLPGRDYSMRLDLAGARFEQHDVLTGARHSVAFKADCVTDLAPGLWLALPASRADRVELLPLGDTPGQAVELDVGCAVSSSGPQVLPSAIIQRLGANGGGVLFVDAGVDAAGDRAVARGGAR